jgi:hypothetical protein
VKETKNGLRLKIFENALQEFKDDEYMEYKNKEIESYLTHDYKIRHSTYMWSYINYS